MTREQEMVLNCTPPFVRFGEQPHRIARRANMSETLCGVILEQVLERLDLVCRSYTDRAYRWSRTPLGDQVAAGRASHGR